MYIYMYMIFEISLCVPVFCCSLVFDLSDDVAAGESTFRVCSNFEIADVYCNFC